MIENIEVIVNKKSLSLSTRKSILGEIYWKVGGNYFPDEGWSDFVIVILGWWIKTINNINYSKHESINKFMFMDGPLFVKSIKVTNDTVKLDFIKEKLNSTEVLYSCFCNIDQLKYSIFEVSKLVLDEMKLKNWKSEDIDELEKLIFLGNQI